MTRLLITSTLPTSCGWCGHGLWCINRVVRTHKLPSLVFLNQFASWTCPLLLTLIWGEHLLLYCRVLPTSRRTCNHTSHAAHEEFSRRLAIMEEMLHGLCLRSNTQASHGHQLPPVPLFSTPSPVVSMASAVSSTSTSSATQGATTNLSRMSLESAPTTEPLEGSMGKGKGKCELTITPSRI